MAMSGGQAFDAGGAGGGSLSRELSSIRFAAVARQLSEVARARGIGAPGFRSPPRLPGVRRSIRHEADGSATIAVALRGRPGLAVVGDLIDGLVVASGLTGAEAGLVRDELWSAVAGVLDDAAGAMAAMTAEAA
jgi:hypothetical protein